MRRDCTPLAARIGTIANRSLVVSLQRAEMQSTMAKQTPPLKLPAAALSGVANSANRAEQLLRRYHEIGRLLNDGDAATVETVAAAEVALLPGYSLTNVYKMRQFASMFETTQLEELLKIKMKSIGKIKMKSTGSTLAWTTVIALLSISKQPDRLKYAKLAARKNLAATALRRRIQKDLKKGNQRLGSGRKIPPPATWSDGLADIIEIAKGLRTRIVQLRATFRGELPNRTDIISAIKSLSRVSRKLIKAQETISAK